MRASFRACRLLALAGLFAAAAAPARAHEDFSHVHELDGELGVTHVNADARFELGGSHALSLVGAVHTHVLAFSTLALDDDGNDAGGPRTPAHALDVWANEVAPHVALRVQASPALALQLGAGVFQRASDHQALIEGEAVPRTRAFSLEAGAIGLVTLSDGVRLETRALAFAAQLHDDVVYDAEGSLAPPIARSSRYGATLGARLAWGALSETQLRATFLDARVAKRSAFVELGRGARVPFVPAFGLYVEQALHAVLEVARERVELGASLGARVLGPRSVPEAARSPAFAQLDAAISARVRSTELALSIENALDARSELAELYYASDLGDPSGDAPAAAAQLTAAPERAFLITLTTYLDAPVGEDS